MPGNRIRSGFWRLWRWALLVAGVVPAAVAAYLWGTTWGGAAGDRSWVEAHWDTGMLLVDSAFVAFLVLMVGVVGGVIRLCRRAMNKG